MSTHAELAAGIARTLTETAIWSDGRCTWVGVAGEDGGRPRHGALGADLYDGVAGVALFLAHVAEVTGDGQARRGARGALRQATWLLERSREQDDGLYVGSMGVALAAIRVGAALGDEEAWKEGVRLAERSASNGPGPLDVVVGSSGRVLALLALATEVDRPVALRAARALADDVMRRGAEIRGTGFAHGRSGAAAALVEMWCAGGDPADLDAGRALMVAERAYLDPREGNWADLREEPRDGVYSYDVAWCHGAPGIGLARLRAFALTDSPQMREEALVALRTTDRFGRAALHAGNFDLSLCHGLCGLAEVLIEGEDALGAAWPGGRAFAEDLVEAAADRHHVDGLPWPSGDPSGQTPALMTGLAGIGLFFLRLHDPTIPSVLLVRPPTPAPAAAGPSRSAGA
jgi:lantibiotic biosynthesis protein